jgi:hypothetical protein
MLRNFLVAVLVALAFADAARGINAGGFEPADAATEVAANLTEL